MKPLALSMKRGRKLEPYFGAEVAPFHPHVWLKETWKPGGPGAQVCAVLDADKARQLRDWLTAAIPHLTRAKTKKRAAKIRRQIRDETRAAP